MASVFISYSHEDKSIALTIAQGLRVAARCSEGELRVGDSWSRRSQGPSRRPPPRAPAPPAVIRGPHHRAWTMSARGDECHGRLLT